MLHQTLDLCREVYNSLVNERTACYDIAKESLSRNTQNKHLTQWKARFPELNTIHSQVLQNISERVELAFQAFFRRVKAGEKPGYPRLKGRGVYNSITFPQADKTGVKLQGDVLSLSKIGQVRCLLHRPLIGKLKTCTLRRLAGKWFACFCCEYEPVSLPPSGESVGIDIGLNQFAALSNGSFVPNPHFFRRDEKALVRAGRKQSKHVKGSIARRKANKVLSRIHERIRNRRHDFVHQTARRLVNRFGLLAVEKLNVNNMLRNPCLAKSISDAAWSMFRSVLASKAESADRQLILVDPRYTSQDCSECGYRANKKLSERWHHCPMCGFSMDRDTNAAWNLLKTALNQKPVWGNTPGSGIPLQEAPSL